VERNNSGNKCDNFEASWKAALQPLGEKGDTKGAGDKSSRDGELMLRDR